METSQEGPIYYRAAKIVFVIGGPGVGKGTQCIKLAADLGLVHISVGDLLREDALTPSHNRNFQIESIMSNASLVPYHYVRSTLNHCLVKHMQNGHTNFLIDGFPRSKEQAGFFDEQGSRILIKAPKDWSMEALLHFHCSEDLMLSRVLKRAEMSGRVDDNLDVFRRRYAAHMQEISNVTGAFKGRIIDVDTERALDDIYEELKGQVKEIFGIE